MSKKVIDETNNGIRLVKETLTDGSKVYQIEITKPITIVCRSVGEAFDTYTMLDKLWIEGYNE